MPEPMLGETKDEFLERCVPDLIKNEKAKFRTFTYNGVKVQATGRRSSDRDDKAWMRTVRIGDRERIVHYADPNMPMRRNNPDARANFNARHKCAGKKDPFSPGFWACYDWNHPSEKATDNIVSESGLTVGETFDLIAGMGSKMEKGEVDYIDPSTNDRETCNKCHFFNDPNRCEVVAGEIAPTAHSVLFIPASQEVEAMEGDTKELVAEQDDKGMHGDAVMVEENTGPVSFAELDQMRKVAETERGIAEVFADFDLLKRNVMVADIEPAEKAQMIAELADEMKVRLDAAMEQKALQEQACQNCGGALLKATDDQFLCGHCGSVYGDEPEIDGSQWRTALDRLETMVDGHTKQQPMKTEGGVKFPASDYAYTPDKERPSTWKLRLTESPGKVTIRQLGRAAAALSPGGFRGRKVELPQDAVSGVKRRIRSEYEKLDVEREDMPASVKCCSSFLVIKETDTGKYRWVAVFSNKFRDRDNPPEILADAAHRDFVKAVQGGEWEMPELWLSHVKGSRVGEADFITYDDAGFPVATGVFDDGMEPVAKALADRDDLLVSHGMPRNEIRREDPDDQTVITRYRSKEISPLKYYKAANQLTGFEIVDGGENMTIPQKDKETLVDLVGEEAANVVELANSKRAEKAAEMELEHKEAATEDQKTAEVGQEVEQVQADTGETAPTDEPEEATQELTKEEIADVIKAAVQAATEPLQDKIAQLEQAVNEYQDDAVKQTLAETPAASLRDLVLGGYTKKDSAVGAKEAKVDGRTALGKDEGPKETPVTHRAGSLPAPFLNDLVSGGDWRKHFNAQE